MTYKETERKVRRRDEITKAINRRLREGKPVKRARVFRDKLNREIANERAKLKRIYG